MKHSAFLSLGIGMALVLQLFGCSEQEESAKTIAEMPTFADDRLMAGRSIWSRTCRACHLLGVEGAPAVTDYPQWETRLRKGKEVLAQRVINGIRDDDGKYRMPPRGGNARLTDEQVKLALDYKIAAIKVLNQPQE
jgi:cytochrome c5